MGTILRATDTIGRRLATVFSFLSKFPISKRLPISTKLSIAMLIQFIVLVPIMSSAVSSALDTASQL